MTPIFPTPIWSREISTDSKRFKAQKRHYVPRMHGFLGYPRLSVSQLIHIDYVNGILTGTHVVLPDMVRRNGGTMINTSSIAGRKTFPNHSVYCGSKFAVHAISESLRKEISNHNVRILVIAPGVVETALLSHTSDEGLQRGYEDWKASIERGPDVKHLADCALFAYQMPQDVSLRELVIAKTKQAD